MIAITVLKILENFMERKFKEIVQFSLISCQYHYIICWGSKPPFSMNDIKKYSGPINLRNSTVKFDLFSLLLQGTR
jgi:hypothetical protein